MFTTTLFIITILDKVTGKVDHNIFTSLTKQDALRQFQTECLKPGTKFHQFPNDYSLICLGTFSDDGKLDTYSTPETIAHASQFREEKQG